MLGLLVVLLGCSQRAKSDCDAGDCSTCRDDTCQDGARCVFGQCQASCAGRDDCEGREVCARVRTDHGAEGQFCIAESRVSGSGDNDGASGDNDAPGKTRSCETSEDCSDQREERCVKGTCQVACLQHAHCGSAGYCDEATTDDDGNPVRLCVADAFPRGPGQFESSCVDGRADCADDFVCITAGEGDLASYCTTGGCQADAECPTGYYCHEQRVRVAPPCEDQCGLRGAPGTENCIPKADIGPDKTYQCTEGGIVEHVCRRKDYCTPCDSDADCAALPNQVCAEGPDGERSCTTLCDPARPSCPWGSASECAVFDRKLNRHTCGPRAGSCRGEGGSCTACLDDRDCPSGFCIVEAYSKERYCFDATTSCECDDNAAACVGGGCPMTPGGLEMNCYADLGGPFQNVCLGAATVPGDPSSRAGCWPQ